MALRGKATPESTRRYAARFPALLSASHFRDMHGLTASSIGIGTYLGEDDEATDRRYVEALRTALLAGCNVVDSAVNYRSQRSERAIGEALGYLVGSGLLRREEVVIATKGGFIPFDSNSPADPIAYFKRTFWDTGIAAPSDVVAGCHIMTPAWVRDQITRSLANMNLDCIDLYYIHNPETQLAEVDRGSFDDRLRAVFETLEDECARGRIQFYGAATWDGLRVTESSPEHLSLETMCAAARRAGGEKHRFRVIQLPYNLGMPEAFGKLTQTHDDQPASTLSAAHRLGFYVMTSASILQGRLAAGLPPDIVAKLGPFETDAQRAIQFVRSTPGVGTALVGMRTVSHVRENLRTAESPPATGQDIRSLFRQAPGE